MTKGGECSLELVRFRRYYGVAWQESGSDVTRFELLASTGSVSFSVGGFVDNFSGKEHFNVMDLSSNFPVEAFYDSFLSCGSVISYKYCIMGYDATDTDVLDFFQFWENKIEQKLYEAGFSAACDLSD